MFRNYFKIAWRNLVRNKMFAAINITGLAIGMSCFILISLYVLDELSYDKFYKNAENIYRVNAYLHFGDADLKFPYSSDMMGQVLKKDYPQVLGYARIYNSMRNKMVRKGNVYINETNVCHADSTLFRIFSLPVIFGDVKTALNEPNTVVITERAALKYFGTPNAIDSIIQTDDHNGTPYKVTAVIKNIPANAHFNFDFYFSMKNVDYRWGQFLSHNFHTYLLLRDGTDYKIFEKNFKDYVDKYCLPEAKQMLQINSMDDFRRSGNQLIYTLIPLTRIHLYSSLPGEFHPGGNIQYIYIFSAVALFILLIACINFMNLTTAHSANRAKEVGIRKMLGTEKKELVSQFLLESLLTTLASMFIGLALVYLVLPLFNDIAGKSMNLGNLFSKTILPVLIGLPLFVGLVAGSYPAFFLSSFRPIEVLKGKIKLGTKSGSLRSLLVVFQFATSIVLIIGTMVIYRQLHYIQTRDIGYNKNQVLIINDLYDLKGNATAFKNQVLQLSGVKSATATGFLPISNTNRNDNVFSGSPVTDAKNGFDMQTWSVDYDYIKTLGMKVIKGRDFSRDFHDSLSVIINETAQKNLGFTDPVGKKIYAADFSTNPKRLAYTIIGVVSNFNYESLKQNVGPVGLFLDQDNTMAAFKINTTDIPRLLNKVEDQWKAIAPGFPFSYRFLDDSFNQMYREEQRIGKIILLFSTIAILIACLGLFGLSTFVAEQRTKEIGIRKVLGASVGGIVELLSKDFLKLVLIAFVVAAPLAWFVMNKWLQDFAYRTDISWWLFVFAGIMSLVIALGTVCFQAIRAAVMNPVKSLRTE